MACRGEASEIVEFRHTLTAHHPQLPPVYSTPDLIRLMETAAFHALHPYCEDGEITVGTSINIEHRAASGVGARVEAEAVLESFDGRFYILRVTARDEKQEIGRGRWNGPWSTSLNSSTSCITGGAEVPFPTVEQKSKAEAFRAMHANPGPVVLINAWDVASARIIAELGFPAIATTSAGIAFAKGFPDGQKIPREEMIAAVAQIAGAIEAPVTADAEAGYGDTPEGAAATARNLIAAGAVGMNFEDATGDINHPLAEMDLQLERIHAIRQAAKELDVPLVLNARTDVYLLQVGDPATRYDEARKRLHAYRDAGADCVFVPGVRDPQTIGRLVSDLACPINILAVPGSPSVGELAALGVKRVSLGSGPMRSALGLLRRLAHEVQMEGTYSKLQDAPSYAEMNRLMNSRPQKTEYSKRDLLS